MSVAERALPSTVAIPLSLRGPAPTRVVVGYGFWLFLLSDIILFSALFAAYAVLSNETAGGPRGVDIFDRKNVLLETELLLMSSFTCGLGAIAVQKKNKLIAVSWMVATLALGAAFIALELAEFRGMVSAGHGPSRSAFLSAFFALVGTHGLHVGVGLLWLLVMLVQVATLGFVPMVRRRLFCFALFWHALDIVWVAVFTIVYLGAR